MLTRLERTDLNTKGVTVTIDEKNRVVSFQKGDQRLEHRYHKVLKPVLENGILSYIPLEENPESAMQLGTAISISRSNIQGLIQPFKQELELKGTGFKAALKNVDGKNTLVLTLGKSHDDIYVIPADIKVTVSTPTQLVLESISKHALGQASAKIRRFRKVDAYKGKGILIKGQVLVLKETKKKK
ncbi:50S ribosomal protein L6 [bacterium]|jgi:large subunit ribosomal protein L6|nr:50S ribosomal protein L6 [bacterium]NBW56428.1 50S ribosomal protein L6 [bacterium]NBX71703.1 50S ribosomal protein L6 [bacterium]